MMKNDLLLAAVGATVGTAYLHESEEPSCFAGYLVRVRPDISKVLPRFLGYWTQSAEYWAQIRAGAIGSTIENFSASRYKAMIVRLPPPEDQVRIATFLDRETAQIDAFIADQVELIGLLAERRAGTIESVFDRAVDRKPLRNTIAIAQTGPFGTQLSATEYVSGGTPVLNPTHIQQGRIEVDNDVSVTPETAAVLSRFAFVVGDIVLGRKGEVDKSALIDETHAGAICGSDSMLIRPDRWTNPRYLWWFFQSVGAHGQLERWSVGSTVSGLNQNTISQIRVPYGDENFQALCVHDLDAEIGELDAAIVDARQAMMLSRERRAALISAAVTGKIDVPSAA
nr:restriction endonuclease subunit S [Cryobacterium sp. Y50]